MRPRERAVSKAGFAPFAAQVPIELGDARHQGRHHRSKRGIVDGHARQPIASMRANLRCTFAIVSNRAPSF